MNENATINVLMDLAAVKFKADRASLAAEDDFFEKLKINSVDALGLLSELETRFNVEVPDYELQDVRTFSALAEVIDRRR